MLCGAKVVALLLLLLLALVVVAVPAAFETFVRHAVDDVTLPAINTSDCCWVGAGIGGGGGGGCGCGRTVAADAAVTAPTLYKWRCCSCSFV